MYSQFVRMISVDFGLHPTSRNNKAITKRTITDLNFMVTLQSYVKLIIIYTAFWLFHICFDRAIPISQKVIWIHFPYLKIGYFIQPTQNNVVFILKIALIFSNLKCSAYDTIIWNFLGVPHVEE